VDVEGAAAETLDGCQDIVGRLGPAERFWVRVVLTDERLDGRDQFLDRRTSSSLDLLFGEEALDLIDP